ncbi:MAG: hypothetical protein WEE51_08880 [Pirellulaceae bacterium]
MSSPRVRSRYVSALIMEKEYNHHVRDETHPRCLVAGIEEEGLAPKVGYHAKYQWKASSNPGKWQIPGGTMRNSGEK